MIAELEGKIPSELSNSEDLLTGNFFGILRYTNLYLTLPYIFKNTYFWKDSHREVLTNSIKEIPDDVELFKFWPKYKGDEIDLIIDLPKYVGKSGQTEHVIPE